jgi:hypothetical protein
MSASIHSGAVTHNWVRGINLLFLLVAGLWAIRSFSPFSNPDLPLQAQGSYAKFSEPVSIVLESPHVELRGVQSFASFELKNKSGGTIDKTNLKLPMRGYYKLEVPGMLPGFGEFSDNITLGAIEAQTKVKLTVWSKQELFKDSGFSAQVETVKGKVPVEFPIEVTGFWAWVMQTRHFLSLLVILLAIKILL